MTIEIIRRKDAIEQGLIRYFTGRPCRNAGHIAERFTANGDCVVCSNVKHLRWARNNRAAVNDYLAKWSVQNPERSYVINKRKSAKWREKSGYIDKYRGRPR